MTKKRNENLTKSEALAIAWKSRENYKGYDKSKGSSFNSWRAIVYTAKGRDIGFPDEWKNYDKFLSDVHGSWGQGKIVCRFDTKKPHSNNNSYWNEKGLENCGKLVKLEYNSTTKTLIEWCAELGLNYQGVRQRYFKGNNHTVEEILFGKIRKVRCQKDRDHDFRLNRMLGAYRLNDKKKGLVNDITIEYFKDEVKNGCIYCGDGNRVGLDRINNSLGHTKNNVVPCCYACNCARNVHFSFDEMKIIGAAIKDVKRIRNENKQR